MAKNDGIFHEVGATAKEIAQSILDEVLNKSVVEQETIRQEQAALRVLQEEAAQKLQAKMDEAQQKVDVARRGVDLEDGKISLALQNKQKFEKVQLAINTLKALMGDAQDEDTLLAMIALLIYPYSRDEREYTTLYNFGVRVEQIPDLVKSYNIHRKGVK